MNHVRYITLALISLIITSNTSWFMKQIPKLGNPIYSLKTQEDIGKIRTNADGRLNSKWF